MNVNVFNYISGILNKEPGSVYGKADITARNHLFGLYYDSEEITSEEIYIYIFGKYDLPVMQVWAQHTTGCGFTDNEAQ